MDENVGRFQNEGNIETPGSSILIGKMVHREQESSSMQSHANLAELTRRLELLEARASKIEGQIRQIAENQDAFQNDLGKKIQSEEDKRMQMMTEFQGQIHAKQCAFLEKVAFTLKKASEENAMVIGDALKQFSPQIKSCQAQQVE